MRFVNNSVAILVAATLPLFPHLVRAQYSSNCPLQGAVFPAPRNLKRGSGPIGTGLDILRDELQKTINSPAVFDNASTSFHLSLFSKDENLLNFSYAASSLDDSSLPSKKLDESTIFRIGSVSKLLTVYALLAEIGSKSPSR